MILLKRFWPSVLCICLLMCFGITVLAAYDPIGSIKIDTVVPSEHMISVNATGNGRILLNGTAANSITAARHGDITLTILPDKGYILGKVLYNGEDVTDDVSSGVITLKEICGDGKLEVIFISDPKGDTPKTGGDSNITLWLLLGGASLTVLSGMAIGLRRRKRCKV